MLKICFPSRREPQNPSKFDEKSMLKVGSVPDRSWDRFSFDLGRIFAPSWEAKSSKNRFGTVLKKVMKKWITLISQPGPTPEGFTPPFRRYLLKAQNHGAKWSRSHLYLIFSPSWFPAFFHCFSIPPFHIDFGSTLAPHLAPESLQKQ